MTEISNAEDYRNRAERAEQALAEMAGWDGLSLAVALRQCQTKLAAAEADADRLAEALEQIACLDDHLANAHLAQRSSFAGFDEPSSVQTARQALAAHNLLKIDG